MIHSLPCVSPRFLSDCLPHRVVASAERVYHSYSRHPEEKGVEGQYEASSIALCRPGTAL